VDSYDGPPEVGLLLPLHWQTVALLLAAVAVGANAVLAADAGGLTGCPVAFVLDQHAQAAVDAGVDDVLALSGHPLGGPAGALPAMILDYAREVPAYADHFGGPRPTGSRVTASQRPVVPLPGLDRGDRLLTCLEPADPAGAAVLLGALTAGASLVLLRAGDASAVASAERATATAGTDVPGLSRVG
jgi:uncharacterized protein (TIGR03089 family)